MVHRKKIKKYYETKEERIKNILCSRNERSTMNFKMALAHNLGLN